MRLLIFTCLAFCIISIFSSCATRQSQILFEQKKTIDSAIEKNTVVANSYHIQSQDLLQIRNLQNINYIAGGAPTETGGGSNNTGSETFQVEENGDVALPVIGYVHVEGLTRMEAAKKIEDLYRTNLLKNPIIELKIVNLKVTMLGEVK